MNKNLKEKKECLIKFMNDELYISNSKKNIDNFIHKNEYKKAFGLFILVIERLDDERKKYLICYYSENMNLGFFR